MSGHRQIYRKTEKQMKGRMDSGLHFVKRTQNERTVQSVSHWLIGNTQLSLKEYTLRNGHTVCHLGGFHPLCLITFQNFTVHEMFQSHLQISLQNVERITLDMRAEKFESLYVKRQLMLSKITKFKFHRHVLLKLANMQDS
jgi:hypothetical protein